MRKYLMAIMVCVALCYGSGIASAAYAAYYWRDICPGTLTTDGCDRCCKDLTATDASAYNCMVVSQCSSKDATVPAE